MTGGMIADSPSWRRHFVGERMGKVIDMARYRRRAEVHPWLLYCPLYWWLAIWRR